MIAFIDYRTSLEEESSLKSLNFTTIRIPKNITLYPEIDGHVDIQLALIDNQNEKFLVIQKDIDISFLNLLNEHNIDYKLSYNSLESTYPKNIILNAYISKNYFVHNLKLTDCNLLKDITNRKLLNVKQGYSKCSILPVTEKAIITNDDGIYKALTSEGFDVLLLPYGDIELPDFDYGFIGGVGGKISDTELAFFGNLNYYKYGTEVLSFLDKYNITPVFLRNSKLYDRGSLIIF